MIDMNSGYPRFEFIASVMLAFAAGVMSQKLLGHGRGTRPPPAVTEEQVASTHHSITVKAACLAPTTTRRLKPKPVKLAADFNKISALLVGTHGMIQNSPEVFARIVAATHRRVPVVAVIAEQAEQLLVIEALEEHGIPTNAVQFMYANLDTEWIRDYGPVFVRRSDGSAVIIDLDYSDVDTDKDRESDDAFPALVGKILGIDVEPLPLFMEGGNLLSNGEGVCSTSVKVVLANERRGYSLDRIGDLLMRHCGLTGWSYLAVPQGESNGHVDMFMVFLAPDIAVVGEIDSKVDKESSLKLDEAAALLRQHETSKGPMCVYRIPTPGPKDGKFRSYTNVVFANGVLLVPVYGDVDGKAEDKAISLYEKLLPDWEIVRIESDAIVEKQGALHCVTLGIPHYVRPDRLFGWHAPELDADGQKDEHADG